MVGTVLNTVAPENEATQTLRDGRSAARQTRRVCFVCTGNTCRSPMAAALFNDLAGRPENAGSPYAGWRALSAGLWTMGGPISMGAVRALAAAGIEPKAGNDYLHHVSRDVCEEMLEACDRVIAVSGAHAMELLGRFPQHASKIYTFPEELADPFGGGDAVYERCLAQIRAAFCEMFGFAPDEAEEDA
jgi:protein-tyrosine-phosphatase